MQHPWTCNYPSSSCHIQAYVFSCQRIAPCNYPSSSCHIQGKRYVIVTQSKRIGRTYFKEFLKSFEKILTNVFYMISFCFLSIHLCFSNDTKCQLTLMLVYNTIISLYIKEITLHYTKLIV